MTTWRNMWRALLLTAAAVIAVSCSSPQDNTTDDLQVHIVDDAAFGVFTPATITVTVGDTVTFVNDSSHPHDVTFDDEILGASPLFDTGETHEVTFDRTGTFEYVCVIHPGMHGNVVVEH